MNVAVDIGNKERKFRQSAETFFHTRAWTRAPRIEGRSCDAGGGVQSLIVCGVGMLSRPTQLAPGLTRDLLPDVPAPPKNRRARTVWREVAHVAGSMTRWRWKCGRRHSLLLRYVLAAHYATAHCPAAPRDRRAAPWPRGGASGWASGRDVTRVEPRGFLSEPNFVESQLALCDDATFLFLRFPASDLAGWVERASTSWITAGLASILASARPTACLPPRSRN